MLGYINKSSDKSRKCELCHFWYFLDKNFNYQKYYCNGCHDISMKAVSINNLASIYSNILKEMLIGLILLL